MDGGSDEEGGRKGEVVGDGVAGVMGGQEAISKDGGEEKERLKWSLIQRRDRRAGGEMPSRLERAALLC